MGKHSYLDKASHLQIDVIRVVARTKEPSRVPKSFALPQKIKAFIAIDSCNQCSCKTYGKVVCSEKKCPSSTTPATTTVECRYEKQVYMLGDIFIAVDKCNKCSCKAKGKVECTKLKCSLSTTTETTLKKIETLFKCFYNGQVHTFGEVFIAVDKCNKCSCKAKGKVECTKLECSLSTHPETTLKKIETLIKCYYNGEIHIIGEVFIAVDKCNKCSCKDNGEVDCTEKKCSRSTAPGATLKNDTSSKCEYNGRMYIVGKVFVAIDKCNNCSCKPKGEVDCTKKKCPVPTTPEPTIQFKEFAVKCYYNETKEQKKTYLSETTKQKNETSGKCSYNGQVYMFGQIFIAIDKCNNCSCKSKEKVECSEKKCPPSTTPATTPQTNETSAKCSYHGQIYAFGQIFTAVDKCNNCSCKSKGKVECTEKKCLPSTTPETTTQIKENFFLCRYHGNVYIIGQTFTAEDKCNTCSCKSNRTITCTERKCTSGKSQGLLSDITTQKIDILIECNYSGKTYKFGQTFIAVDKCNQCTCKTKGNVTCTSKTCPPKTSEETTTQKIDIFVVCRYNGQIFKFGQTFTAIDKCNKCICKRKGNIVCTKNTCLSAQAMVGERSPSQTNAGTKCSYHGKIYKITETFVAIDQCNSCECIFPGQVLCTHNICEQSKGKRAEAQASQINKYPIINLEMKCFYHGKIYKITETFISVDECNSCECIYPGRVICGQSICEETIVAKPMPNPSLTVALTCEYDGVTYKAGISFISADGCNKCRCTPQGKIACLKSVCPAKVIQIPPTAKLECRFQGISYKIGTVFVSKDGCSTCKCSTELRIMCSDSFCIPKIGKSKASVTVMCKSENACYSVDSIFITIDGCSSCRCQKSGKVRCTKICGWKSKKACTGEQAKKMTSSWYALEGQ
ncbi:kielin chordin [Octopus vulgaris]|uniref:Kielin chordin n=1 Tax=Octopus vulgaris TaxID=6645 RepID=A0AA36FA11_OCTVU|nr:kielin chordin [Octopus vulgaris]